MVTTTTTEKYRVVLTVPPYLTRRDCRICGYGVVGKDDVIAVIEPRVDMDAIYAVCHECLEAGPEKIAERLTEHAENLEHRAGILRLMAQGEWVMPTLADLCSFD
ncbi:MAG TPA: hypothetical protein VGS60_02510 [Actinomycetes bacterium]|jgi:hypothetical protein|nr:hypothetical protein [Actinomycetes bacterium]